MNADEYQKLAMRTAATPDLFNNNVDGSMDDVLHALLGIGTEAGELQDMLKKHLMYGKAFDRTNLVEECGDLLWYIALALKTVNVTMSDCMERNIKKLQVRYPQKFTTENALNRNLEQEARVLAPSAPAKPERVAVLRHRDGWHVYSDGSDDEPGNSMGTGFWAIAPCKAGERRLVIGRSVPGDTYTALIDWPPRPADERVDQDPPPTQECDQCGAKADASWTHWQCPGGSLEFGSCDGTLRPIEPAMPPAPEPIAAKVLRTSPSTAAGAIQSIDGLEPEARTMAEARRDVAAMQEPKPAVVEPYPEPEVPAAVRPWLDAACEVWPEMRAGFETGDDVWCLSRGGFTSNECDAFMSFGDDGSWLLGERHEKELVYYDTPAALVAALKKKLGAPEPKPEPPRPALWEMVRAACESKLGDPDWSHGHLRFRTKKLRSVWAYPHIKRPEWVVDYPGNEVFCRTPAELTAALNGAVDKEP